MSTIEYLNHIWEKTHKKLKEENNYRKLFNHFNEDANKNINFSSNDYLNLRHDKRICAAGYNSAKMSGSGSGASRSVLQTDVLIEKLENYFCENTEFKRSLFLASGFVANLTFFDVLSPLGTEEIDQEFFVDHRCHASIFFALRSSGLNFSVFRHNDMSHLEKKLKISHAQAKIIVIESLYSMDGDFAPANELAQLCEKHKAFIFIDESHSFGIFGKKGAGWIQEHPNLKKHLIAATFGCGKAAGVSGAFLATNYPTLIERILQKSKLFIYSTGISPFVSGAVYESLQILFHEEGAERRTLLFENMAYLVSKINDINFQFPIILERKMHSQIFPFIFYSNDLTMKISNYLIENNFIAKAIRPPSVPNHTSRLRVCLTSAHNKEDIDSFIYNLNKVLS